MRLRKPSTTTHSRRRCRRAPQKKPTLIILQSLDWALVLAAPCCPTVVRLFASFTPLALESSREIHIVSFAPCFVSYSFLEPVIRVDGLDQRDMYHMVERLEASPFALLLLLFCSIFCFFTCLSPSLFAFLFPLPLECRLLGPRESPEGQQTDARASGPCSEKALSRSFILALVQVGVHIRRRRSCATDYLSCRRRVLHHARAAVCLE